MSTDKSQKDFLGNKRKNVSISNLKLKIEIKSIKKEEGTKHNQKEKNKIHPYLLRSAKSK